MKKNHQRKTTTGFPFARLSFILVIACTLLLCSRADAKFRFERSDSDTVEKKVDYLEQIYFSGGNKAELTGQIQAATQKLDGKSVTLSVAKQYAFLKGIQQSAEDAGSSCDVEEMLAAGIYSIDANEAMLQGISKPGKKATKNADGALNAVNNLSQTAADAAWSGWYLSGGSISGFGAASKLGAAASTLNVASNAVKTFNKIKELFPKADKPCKEVKAKAVEIGSHIAPPPPSDIKTETQNNAAQQPVIVAPVTHAAGTVKLTIKNITYNQMNAIKPSIEKIAGVTVVTISGYSESIAVITVASGMKTDELANKILAANKAMNLEVAGLSPQEIMLVKK